MSSVLADLLEKYHGEPDMPQTLEEMIRVSEVRVLSRIGPSRIVESLPPEMLRETQDLIARRLAELDKLEKKKPALPRAAKSRRKTGIRQ